MSRTRYYYADGEIDHMVEEPGELCDICSELARIVKAGTLVPIPVIADCCGGSEEGNAHAHRACAETYLADLERQVADFRKALARGGG